MLTAEQSAARHGFWLARGGPDGGWWLYVPVGFDPTDGQPLTQARKASVQEVAWWQCGTVAPIKAVLRNQGVMLPVDSGEPKRSRWKRLAELFRRRK